MKTLLRRLIILTIFALWGVLAFGGVALAVHDGTAENRFCGTGSDIAGANHKFGMIGHYNENGYHKHRVWVTGLNYGHYHEHIVRCGYAGDPNHARFPGGYMHTT